MSADAGAYHEVVRAAACPMLVAGAGQRKALVHLLPLAAELDAWHLEEFAFSLAYQVKERDAEAYD